MLRRMILGSNISYTVYQVCSYTLPVYILFLNIKVVVAYYIKLSLKLAGKFEIRSPALDKSTSISYVCSKKAHIKFLKIRALIIAR